LANCTIHQFFLKTGEYQFYNVNSTRSHVDDVINVNMDTNVVAENLIQNSKKKRFVMVTDENLNKLLIEKDALIILKITHLIQNCY
jgi:hypothetical protein